MKNRYEQELTKRIRAINARITTVQRIYGKDSSIFQRIQSTIKKAGGTTSRFSKKMFNGSLRDLSKAENALRTVENSKYLTKEGRKRIGVEARKTFGIKYGERGYNDAQIEKMYDVFKNTPEFNKLSEYGVSSEVVVDMIMTAFETENISATDMSKYLNDNIRNFIQNSTGRMADEKTNDIVNQFWDGFINDTV